MAHPDDIEFTCAGTLAHLKRAGWDIHLATMTAGDLGTATLSRGAHRAHPA
jgi:LmbE family N-acetylglucosaminyl deacetylase